MRGDEQTCLPCSTLSSVRGTTGAKRPEPTGRIPLTGVSTAPSHHRPYILSSYAGVASRRRGPSARVWVGRVDQRALLPRAESSRAPPARRVSAKRVRARAEGPAPSSRSPPDSPARPLGPRGRAKGSSAETRAEPWLPLPDDHDENNVAAKREDPSSIPTLHRRLLALRRAAPALQTGSYTPVPATGDGLSYTREANGSRYLVALNLGHGPRYRPAAARTPRLLHPS